MLSERFQPWTHTTYNRYPLAWKRVASLMRGKCKRILCFGCSTGEECYTALVYFPSAQVVGVEYDRTMLRFAMLRHAHPSIMYVPPSSMEGLGMFDLVVANSVFCNYPENTGKDVNDMMSFGVFSDAMGVLHGMLLPGGVFMLNNAEYFFRDLSFAEGYLPQGNPEKQNVTLFNKDGGRSSVSKAQPIWRKKPS